MIRRCLLLVTFFTFLYDTDCYAVDLMDIFPVDQMQDQVSLDLQVGERNAYSSTQEPGRTLQRMQIQFTSFEWAGETWRHRAELLLPDRSPDIYRGTAAIISGGNKAHQKMAEATALMGIPVLRIVGANPGPHYGVKQEGNLMGYGQKQYYETSDPRWIGYAWLGKIIVRAVTAAQALPEIQAERFVVTGCSKRGAASWIAAAADDRIIGAYPTCWNAGNGQEFIQLKAERWGLDYQPRSDGNTMAPAFITTQQQMEISKHPMADSYASFVDPYRYGNLLRGKKILYAAGTNDPLFPPVSGTVFLPHMSANIRSLLVPNAGHTMDTDRHLNAWRMWLAHCFAGRGVPDILVDANRQGNNAVVTATVKTRTHITAVRIWSATDPKGAYLKTKWQSTAMEKVGDGQFRATLAAPQNDYLGYFVEVVDRDPKTVSGTITSGFNELKPEM